MELVAVGIRCPLAEKAAMAERKEERAKSKDKVYYRGRSEDFGFGDKACVFGVLCR